jgi:hypothetical protein
MDTNLIDYIKTPAAVKERCAQLLEVALKGGTHFSVNLEKISECAALVAKVTKERFPTLKIPPHSRWGHFNGGGINRLTPFESQLQEISKEERARSLLDLVIVSVLLDAGAGAEWKYLDKENGTRIGRSEGLAIASLDMFKKGIFSKDKSLSVTAEGLENLDIATLKDAFQSTKENFLEGLEGRFELLKKLAEILNKDSRFEVGNTNRPGAIFDIVTKQSTGKDISAVQIFRAVLDLFGGIWPAHPNSFGVALGDVWEHPAIKGTIPQDKLVPFHKLSLWLTFSLFHGFEIGGFNIKDVDELPGLAEYRNGGLLVDSGVLSRKDLTETGPFEPNHQMIIEWRALTIALLDKVADEVRNILGKNRTEFPLAAVLEGGTWFAGRKLAAQNRPDSSPPIPVVNKGNVF